MSIPKMLASTTARFALPLAVRCTAILLYYRLEGSFAGNKKILVYLCLLMGCKFEDVHARLDRLLLNAGCSQADLYEILELEVRAMEQIGFDFAFPNLYVKAQALRYVLEEKDVALGSEWQDDCQRIDALLCAEGFGVLLGECMELKDELYNSIAFGSIDVDTEYIGAIQGEGVPISGGLVERVRGILSGDETQHRWRGTTSAAPAK